MPAPTFDASDILDPLYRRIKEVASWNARNLMARGRFLTLEEMDAVTASALKRATVKIEFNMAKPKEITILCDYAWFEKDDLLLKLYKEVERLLPKVPEKTRPSHSAARIVTEWEQLAELREQAIALGYTLVPTSDED